MARCPVWTPLRHIMNAACFKETECHDLGTGLDPHLHAQTSSTGLHASSLPSEFPQTTVLRSEGLLSFNPSILGTTFSGTFPTFAQNCVSSHPFPTCPSIIASCFLSQTTIFLLVTQTEALISVIFAGTFCYSFSFTMRERGTETVALAARISCTLL